MSIKPTITEIPIESLKPGRFQPRQQFDSEELALLAETIKLHGLIQPIVVRPIGDHYEIVAGERRWRAAQLAGLHEVIGIVKNYTDEQTAAVSTIENTGRVNLNPIEEAKAYQQLITVFNYTHDEVAAIVGQSRVKITNALRLLKLDHSVQQYLISGELSEGHGKVLAGIELQKQAYFATHCINNHWSIRKLEQAIKKKPFKNVGIQTLEDPDIATLTRFCSEQLNTEIVFENNHEKSSGWLKIKYYDADTLAGLLERMNIKLGE